MYYHSIKKAKLIKWWQISYDPTVRKIFSTKEEQDEYEAAQAKLKESKANEELLHNKNFNAATGSMSGEYGKKEMDDSTKAQLDSILKSNYNAMDVSSMVASSQDSSSSPEDVRIEKLCNTSNLSPEKAAEKEEQIRRANEIYERLLREAKEDEQKRQDEIEQARQAAL